MKPVKVCITGTGTCVTCVRLFQAKTGVPQVTTHMLAEVFGVVHRSVLSGSAAWSSTSESVTQFGQVNPSTEPCQPHSEHLSQ